MITKADIVERVVEWSLTEEVVEKDYVLGWLLWGIGSDPVLGDQWIFKGGTCLKKCYIETYRFSEDLDFTVLPGGPFRPEHVEPLLARTLVRVTAESGLQFGPPARLRLRPPRETSTEGRVYYRGPRQARNAAMVKLDITSDEPVIRPPVFQDIGHPYPDAFPGGGRVRCYSFEELFAEKIRAMAQRGRPRDLYDIINLFRRSDLRLYPDVIRTALAEKCATKGIPIPTAADFIDSPLLADLMSSWESMLGHQLPALPPLHSFLDELPTLFAWLDGIVETVEARAPAYGEDDDAGWSPPPTVWTWRSGVPLETVRFAAANHLLVDLTYQGSRRLIEPYSLRRTKAGNLILHAERADGGGHRAYRVDQMQALQATTQPFQPRFPIEFSARGPLHAPPHVRTARLGVRTTGLRSGSALEYIYRCTRCGREFPHSRRSATLRAHNDELGTRCPGRHGQYLGTRP